MAQNDEYLKILPEGYGLVAHYKLGNFRRDVLVCLHCGRQKIVCHRYIHRPCFCRRNPPPPCQICGDPASSKLSKFCSSCRRIRRIERIRPWIKTK